MAYLKAGVTRKQSTPNFSKNEHFLPPDSHTENVSCNTRLEIRPFTLMPKKWLNQSNIYNIELG